MILTSHQPVYLPWAGLIHKIALADAYCFFDVAQYLLKDWNNRNKIKSSSGPIWLSVPVQKKGYVGGQIKDIKIAYDAYDWRAKHWLSLLHAYKKAPHFSAYADFFEDLYRREWEYLADLNEYVLKYLLDAFGVKVRFFKASEHRFAGAKSDQVLDMCLQVQADAFLFGAQGRNYAVEEDFLARNVKIWFQEYRHPEYRQLHGDFVSHLAVVDLLFNEGASRGFEILMEGNASRGELEAALFPARA